MVIFDAEAMSVPLLVALAAAAIVALAEWRHAARVRRVARLAFGPGGQPAAWARLAPAIRVAGALLATFGAMVLLRFDPIETEVEQAENAGLVSLAALEPGTSAEIVRLAEHDGDLLHWFYDQGLVPGTELTVLHADRAAGQLTIEIDGSERAIGERAAAGLYVLPA